MIWPFKSKPKKDDPLATKERENDDLRFQLREMRERLLHDTLREKVAEDDR